MDGQPLCWKTENGLLRLGPSKDKDSKRAIFGVSPADAHEHSMYKALGGLDAFLLEVGECRIQEETVVPLTCI